MKAVPVFSAANPFMDHAWRFCSSDVRLSRNGNQWRQPVASDRRGEKRTSATSVHLLCPQARFLLVQEGLIIRSRLVCGRRVAPIVVQCGLGRLVSLQCVGAPASFDALARASCVRWCRSARALRGERPLLRPGPRRRSGVLLCRDQLFEACQHGRLKGAGASRTGIEVQAELLVGSGEPLARVHLLVDVQLAALDRQHPARFGGWRSMPGS